MIFVIKYLLKIYRAPTRILAVGGGVVTPLPTEDIITIEKNAKWCNNHKTRLTVRF